MTFALTGALGKRTKFQQQDTAQLLLQVTSDLNKASTETTLTTPTLPKVYYMYMYMIYRITGNFCPEKFFFCYHHLLSCCDSLYISILYTYTTSLLSLTQNLLLGDDTLLDHVQYVEAQSTNQLTPLQQTVLIGHWSVIN